MEGLSIGEILLIAVAIVVLFGPDKLPQIARDLGSGVRKMRGAVEDIKTEIMKETDNPVSEIKREIDKVKKSATDFDFGMNSNPIETSTAENTEKIEKIDQLHDGYEGPVSR